VQHRSVELHWLSQHCLHDVPCIVICHECPKVGEICLSCAECIAQDVLVRGLATYLCSSSNDEILFWRQAQTQSFSLHRHVIIVRQLTYNVNTDLLAFAPSQDRQWKRTLRKLELLAVHAGRTLGDDPLCQIAERYRGFAVWLGHRDGVAVIATSPQGRHEGDLAQQRETEVFGQQLATASAEELVGLAVVTGEVVHVLNDASD